MHKTVWRSNVSENTQYCEAGPGNAYIAITNRPWWISTVFVTQMHFKQKRIYALIQRLYRAKNYKDSHASKKPFENKFRTR